MRAEKREKSKMKISHPSGGCYVCTRGFYGFFEEESESAYFEFTFDDSLQGPPGCAHGGAIATMIDEVMSFATAKRFPCLLAKIQINYRKPVPLHTRLTFEGKVVSAEGRKVFTEGMIKLGDEILVEAKGIYIRPKDFSERPMKIIK